MRGRPVDGLAVLAEEDEAEADRADRVVASAGEDQCIDRIGHCRCKKERERPGLCMRKYFPVSFSQTRRIR